MHDEERLQLLLDSWLDAQDQGQAASAVELCRDRPELRGELERRIGVLRRFEQLTDTDLGLADDDTPAPQELPAQVGAYRVLGRLGEGGMGCVYRAEDPVLRRQVAVKVMRRELAARPGARERFLREARSQAAVPHEHIVPIYHVGEEGVPFLVMPLLDGETLQQRLQRQPVLPAAEVVRIGRQTAEALAAAHERGLIHRDVKPSNIWLAKEARAKVLDFGLARPLDEAEPITRSGVLVGTPMYMSPEQVNGEPLDGRSDVFSLGVVLYRMATGGEPFRGANLTAMLRAVAEQEPAPPDAVNPKVPEALADLIRRMLAKDRAARPDAAEVAEALRAIEEGSALPTTEWRPRRRRMPFLGGVAALVFAALLVLAAGGYGLWRGLRPAPGPAPEAAPPGPIPETGPLTASLDVRVWKKDDKSRGLTLGKPGALPLQAGDWMRIEARASRSAYLYLLYLDARGEASPMYPWRKYKWNDRPREIKQQTLNLPEDPRKDGAPLDPGPSGIEAVLLLARDEPLTAEENSRLAKLFADAAPQDKFDPLQGAVWLGGAEAERFSEALDRGRPNVDDAGRVEDPVERVRRLLRDEVGALGVAARGVCYPFTGP
jgi:hypothetical protein